MKKLYAIVFLSVLSSTCFAQRAKLAGCTNSVSSATLDISNVSTLILHNGDMWWDAVSQTNVARYEIPRGSGKTSLFAGAIWIGAKDAGNNLYVAAQTYRQQGSDFWPGPLDTTTVDVSPTTCLAYDRFWNIKRQDVLDFISGNPATPDMISYPGNGSGAQAHFLAPFFDNNGDGIYNTADGDYPLFDYISGGPNCNGALHGDQSIWFVYNDVGNIHTESSSAYQLGIEIQEQAFAFRTSDADINNSTFYQYKIINRNSVNTYNNTYIGAWVDPDLGFAGDDFVGCDVKRGLGFCYNADEDDEGAQGYGINPPAVGMDFLQGPLADAGDGVDNNRDSVIDEPGEQIIMSGFVYYTNTGGNGMGDPTVAPDYYNYLSNKWTDGVHFEFGGNGKGGGNCATTTPCSFMFPGTSDPYGWGTNGAITASNFPACWNWSEETALDLGGDRRFMQSAGPFTFLPGAVQNITTAAVWARASSGGRLASVAKLLAADDDMKILAGNCWNVTPFIFATDAGIASIISPPGDTLCDSVFTPMVRLQNFGSTILTSATINYQLDGNPVQTVPWSGSLAWLDTADILLPVFSTTAGAHTFTAYTTNPNSSPDQHTVNDTIRIDFLINTGLLLPLTEGFETGTFPPANWTVSYINTYHLGLSRFLSGGFGNSTASMRAFCYGRTISSNVDFTSTGLNIDGLFAPADMTFSLAYAQRSDTSADTLQIYISIDCGSTFTLAYSKTGTALATTINHATGYLPLATDWRTDTVDLAPYLGQPHLMVKFRFLSGNSQHPGNNIYVDDINIIAAPLAVNALNPGNAMHVYPNPAKDNFIIQLNENLSNAELEIFNIMGEAVLQSKINQRLTTISTKDLAPGIYFVKVGDGKNAFIQKLVIE